jgi:hypothetical protein
MATGATGESDDATGKNATYDPVNVAKRCIELQARRGATKNPGPRLTLVPGVNRFNCLGPKRWISGANVS